MSKLFATFATGWSICEANLYPHGKFVVANTDESNLTGFIKTMSSRATLRKERKEVDAPKQIIGSMLVQVFLGDIICRGIVAFATSENDEALLTNLTLVFRSREF